MRSSLRLASIFTYFKPSRATVLSAKPRHLSAVDIFQRNNKRLISDDKQQSRYLNYNPLFQYDNQRLSIEDYIVEERFNSLSDDDKIDLNLILFTTGGMFALHEGFITVDKFLSLSLHARQVLKRFFRNDDNERGGELQLYSDICKYFGRGYIDLGKLTFLSPDKCTELSNLINEAKEEFYSYSGRLELHTKLAKIYACDVDEVLLRAANDYYNDYYIEKIKRPTVSISAFETSTLEPDISHMNKGFKR